MLRGQTRDEMREEATREGGREGGWWLSQCLGRRRTRGDPMVVVGHCRDEEQGQGPRGFLLLLALCNLYSSVCCFRSPRR